MYYLDIRNNNKVIILKEINKDTVMVQSFPENKRYLVDKCNLQKVTKSK